MLSAPAHVVRSLTVPSALGAVTPLELGCASPAASIRLAIASTLRRVRAVVRVGAPARVVSATWERIDVSGSVARTRIVVGDCAKFGW